MASSPSFRRNIGAGPSPHHARSGRCYQPVGHLSFDWRFLTSELVVRVLIGVIGFLCSRIEPFKREVYGVDWYNHYFPFAERQRVSEALATIILVSSIVVLPLVALSLLLWLKKMPKRVSVEEVVNFVLGLSLALLLTFALTEIIKNSYARLRPDFLSRCFGNDKAQWPVSDVALLPAVPECTNADITSYLARDGRKSFPSAHAALAAATYLYCGLWLYRKLSQCKNTGSWRIAVPVICSGVAIWIGITRTADYRHFASDVVAGLAIGAALAAGTWRFYDEIMSATYARYRKLYGWDADDNCDLLTPHLPAMFLYEEDAREARARDVGVGVAAAAGHPAEIYRVASMPRKDSGADPAADARRGGRHDDILDVV